MPILAENQNGHQLLEFHPSAQPISPDAESHIPIPFALAVAQYQGNMLFVWEKERQAWELPGGRIEPGETPEAAAKRELFEETSQIAANLRFVGLAKIYIERNNQLVFGAIYACEIESIQPFQANEEISQIMWWDMESAVNGYFDEIDRKLAEMTMYIIENRS